VKTVKNLLIQVAKGRVKTHHPENRTITHQELWSLVMGIAPVRFERRHVEQVILWIEPVGEQEIRAARPPVHALVVDAATQLPPEDLDAWNKQFRTSYKSFWDAQAECWEYYGVEGEWRASA